MPPRSARAVALDPRRSKALELFAEGLIASEIAEEIDVDAKTIWRWTQEPLFAAELHALRKNRRAAAKMRFDALALDSVKLLRALIDNPFVEPAVRLNAAKFVLERACLDEPTRPDPIKALPPSQRIERITQMRATLDAHEHEAREEMLATVSVDLTRSDE